MFLKDHDSRDPVTSRRGRTESDSILSTHHTDSIHDGSSISTCLISIFGLHTNISKKMMKPLISLAGWILHILNIQVKFCQAHQVSKKKRPS